MIRVRQIKIAVAKDNQETIKSKVCQKLKCPLQEVIDINIIKKSLDARFKPDLYYIYEVDVTLKNQSTYLRNNSTTNDIIVSPIENYQFPKIGDKKLNHVPIVVGSGPAGLFCAYLLAEHGFHPLIIERGEPVQDRIQSVEHFWKTGQLNPNSNVQFGEGGAGTFSDGKLNTLVKDKEYRMKKVFEIFVACGADPEILYTHNPHIGTDVLRQVVINLRNKIIDFGGSFLYNTCLTDIKVTNQQITAIEINHQTIIETDVLILAIGHSARDTFEMLEKNNLPLESKPFAIGLRIQHPQKLINQNQYGKNYPSNLPPASYKLTYQTKDHRGVYSFCMCPGGYVVNASSEPGRLVINGMSNHDRASLNANSALVVTVGSEDYGTSPLAGLTYQRHLEEQAYKLGNGKIPVQLVKDFITNTKTTSLGNIKPIFKGEYELTNLNQILPDFISSSIKEALPHFGKKIQNFDQDDAILAGIESRTSSPIRILRDDQYESPIKGIYPCGEGAGYAGGITTSAMDGIKVAESIATIYNNTIKEKK